MSTPEQQLVLDWHAALNAGDVQRLLALSDPQVEVGGPRGRGRGANLLEEWVARARIQLLPGRILQDGPRVVVDQQAAWSGGETQLPASLFEVREGRVTRVIRYADLQSALQASAEDPEHG